ncbi:hypothetical protein EDD11_005591, partial [Mortierella claussenii]
RAKAEEYRQITNSLLKIVDGSLGAKREDKNKVIIGVGLGEFSPKTRLTSLHEFFRSHFVQKASYIVVGVEEYYTSKKCPVCEEFVDQVNLRRFYCSKCK